MTRIIWQFIKDKLIFPYVRVTTNINTTSFLIGWIFHSEIIIFFP